MTLRENFKALVRGNAMMRSDTECEQLGAPLCCISWFYVDPSELDWGWLLEYSDRAVQDATDLSFWGVTPHNHVQPHFGLWKDEARHEDLNHRFLSS